MKKSILLALVCIGSLATRAQKIIEKHIPFSPKNFVSMNFQISDSIHIITWKKDEVYIKSSIDVNDNTAVGKPLFPEIIYGANIGLSWKGLDLTMLWQGAADASIYLTDEYAYPFYNGAKIFQQQTDYWTPTHTNAKYPRILPNPSTNNTQPSSFWMTNGSYLRLKTAELGYALPASVMKRVKLRSVRFFVSGQNLLTFSALKFLDPETGSNRGRYYFQQKVFSFGTNIGF